jgi:hypothetical protein
MKKRNEILILIFSIAIIIAFLLFLTSPLEKQSIPTRFIVGENMGFDLGPGNINFGLIVPGAKTTRNLAIQNNYEFPTITKIKTSGPVSICVIVSENNFVLQPNEIKELTFSCIVPEGLELGEYPGKIIIITNKA